MAPALIYESLRLEVLVIVSVPVATEYAYAYNDPAAGIVRLVTNGLVPSTQFVSMDQVIVTTSEITIMCQFESMELKLMRSLASIR
jgi:hypothetical protein